MNLAQQMKALRKQLGLQQKDMKLRIGMEQQQYSHIEAGANANLKNLELIAEGLDAELMLIPREKRYQVQALLAQTNFGNSSARAITNSTRDKRQSKLNQTHLHNYQVNEIDDPWEDILD